jgi:serine/threonine protein phosphatase 1
MVFAIGDIHGALEKLNSLIRILPVGDELIFLGDYLDKGPHSRAVIDRLIELSKERPCRFLIGNHEFVWLEHLKSGKRADFLTKFGGLDTVASYMGNEQIPSLNDISTLRDMFARHQNFFTALEPYVSGESWLCVHGGIAPNFGDAELFYHDLEQLVFLRFAATAGDNTWQDKTVICGHCIVGAAPVTGKNTIAIDTGAWTDNGRLTALNLEDYSYIQDDGQIGSVTLK